MKGKRPSCMAEIFLLSLLIGSSYSSGATRVGVWMKFEGTFRSDRSYENPLYDVERFVVHFQSPTERRVRVNGFWDGGLTWKIRFAPDETGEWTYRTECSDISNSGLHNQSGSFQVVDHDSERAIYTRGSIIRVRGSYHLAHADGTPFFWTADTAWNGALKSTDREWRKYLQDRVRKGYNAIQLVTTQWRGGDADRHGRVAFEGSDRIRINPDFFQRLDRKIDMVNEHGLVAAPVLLWALPFGEGRHLSPGYYLPDPEAILLARYMVARYGGNQVVWFLGGDGRYVQEYEQRWKEIGRAVFGQEHPGIVAQHPHGRSWIGEAYSEEQWLDIVGYQSSHSTSETTTNWINKGPVSKHWDTLPPRPIINLEPIYEQIHRDVTARDVRNACYWSVFASPPAGITYGANGVWPWLRSGEKILNHRDAPWTSPWQESLDLPGAVQIGYLSSFIQSFDWWNLRPAHEELLLEQPGEKVFNRFVSVLRTKDFRTVLAYVPDQMSVAVRNPLRLTYEARWFDPRRNEYSKPQILEPRAVLRISSPLEADSVLVLTAGKKDASTAR